MNKKLLIVGASGQGKVVLDIFQSSQAFTDFAFLDDSAARKGMKVLGIPVAGTSADLNGWRDKGYQALFVAIGDNLARERLQTEAEKAGFEIPTAIHPRAIISQYSKIGAGTAIMAGVIVSTNATIGKGCIINTGSSVDHDNTVGDFCQVMPGARLTGTVRLGRRAYIGTGAIILPNLTLCDDANIGAGTVVTRNVDSTEPLVGIPARPLSKKTVA